MVAYKFFKDYKRFQRTLASFSFHIYILLTIDLPQPRPSRGGNIELVIGAMTIKNYCNPSY